MECKKQNGRVVEVDGCITPASLIIVTIFYLVILQVPFPVVKESPTTDASLISFSFSNHRTLPLYPTFFQGWQRNTAIPAPSDGLILNARERERSLNSNLAGQKRDCLLKLL